MPLSSEQRSDLRLACKQALGGFKETDPAETLRRAAAWCEENAVQHDVYGGGKVIADFEEKIAQELGKQAAAFMPSGIMAQLIAARIWCEQQDVKRIGLHASSHLIGHEEQAFEALFGLHGVVIGDAQKIITAEDLKRVAEPLACLFIELPMRELGGVLPNWEELEALKRSASDLGIMLHMDGARLWESRAFYQRSYAEISEGFDSVYVSLYKGIGGVAGAILAGDASFIANAKLWRRRMGGTLPRMSPMIATAAMRFDERLAILEQCFERTKALAKSLAGIAGIRILPATPQCNMMHVFFDRPREALLDARDKVAAEDGVWLLGWARDADTPGFSRTELYIGDNALEISDDHAADLFRKLMLNARP
jgi:threonine aldolase